MTFLDDLTSAAATRIVPASVWNHIGEHHRIALSSRPWYAMLADLQTTFNESTMDFWRARGAKTLHLPVTTGSISSPMGAGSDSMPVAVDLLGVPTYLADSMQFMLEYGCRLTSTDTYYVMPSFRGEQTSKRHLAQFFHSEAEIHGGLDDVITVVQAYLRHLAIEFLERHADQIIQTAGTVAHVEALAGDAPFHRLTFDEAASIVPAAVEHHDGWRTLSHSGEQELMQTIGQFTWVTHWDHLAVPFYQAYADGSSNVALNGDLLFGIGETVGLGERHRTAADLRSALAQHEVAEEPYQWYVEMRELQELRTAGFGLGVERFFMWLTGHDDIRDMQIFPRENGRAITP